MGAGRAQSRCQLGEERVLPGPDGTDLQGALTGAMGEPGGNVPDAVAERVRAGSGWSIRLAEYQAGDSTVI